MTQGKIYVTAKRTFRSKNNQGHNISTQRQTLALVNMKFHNPSNCQLISRKAFILDPLLFAFHINTFVSIHIFFFVTGSFRFLWHKKFRRQKFQKECLHMKEKYKIDTKWGQSQDTASNILPVKKHHITSTSVHCDLDPISLNNNKQASLLKLFNQYRRSFWHMICYNFIWLEFIDLVRVLQQHIWV